MMLSRCCLLAGLSPVLVCLTGCLGFGVGQTGGMPSTAYASRVLQETGADITVEMQSVTARGLLLTLPINYEATSFARLGVDYTFMTGESADLYLIGPTIGADWRYVSAGIGYEWGELLLPRKRALSGHGFTAAVSVQWPPRGTHLFHWPYDWASLFAEARVHDSQFQDLDGRQFEMVVGVRSNACPFIMLLGLAMLTGGK